MWTSKEDPEIKYLELPKYTRKHYETLTRYLNKIAKENDEESPINKNLSIGTQLHIDKLEIWIELSSCVGILSAYDFRDSFSLKVLSSLKASNPASYKALVCPFKDLPKLVNHKFSKFIALWRLENGI